MYRLVILAVCLSGICIFPQGEEVVRYEGYKVVRVIPQKEQHLLDLQSLQNQPGHEEIDFWTPPRQVGQPVLICISPALFDRLYFAFKLLGLYPVVTIEDVQRSIDAQKNREWNFLLKNSDLQCRRYNTLKQISDWINKKAKEYDFASIFNITTSFEGRQIQGIRINTNKEPSKPAFWIQGGIHAREWISPATVVYMTKQMLEEYGRDQQITSMVDSYDWYILPVFNVDGYEYTWTTNRMWRKTRSRQNDTQCVGVDPNRNWDYRWCEQGASQNPCSDIYCGPSAFSEVEVKGVADYIESIPNVRGFIDFHSYSQLWMFPWGYTKDDLPDINELEESSRVAVTALEAVHGTRYAYGSIANIIYLSSGSSADWTYGAANITYSYGVELRDKGSYGFLLPPDQIKPSGEETLQALIALANYIKKNP